MEPNTLMDLGGGVGWIGTLFIGALAGKAVAEAYSPEAEDAHWRERYTQEPYYQSGRSYDDYGPAYRYGAQSRASLEDDWDTAATRLESGWEGARGSSSLNWEEARPASRAAWDRMDTRRSQGLASDGSSTSFDSAEAAGLTGSSASSSSGSPGMAGTSGTTGAGGVGGDIATFAAMGAHGLPVVATLVMRDTAEVFDQHVIEADAVAEQARTVLEDISIAAWKCSARCRIPPSTRRCSPTDFRKLLPNWERRIFSGVENWCRMEAADKAVADLAYVGSCSTTRMLPLKLGCEARK